MRMKIETMRCGGCAAAVRRAVESAAPSAEIRIDVARKEVEVLGAGDEDAVRAAIAAAGHTIAGAAAHA